MTYVLDAHALIWSLTLDPRLGPSASAVLKDPASDLILPAIALAEACWTVAPGKSAIPSAEALIAAVETDSRIRLVALDRELIRLSHAPRMHVIREMHDRQIVATALRLINSGEPAALLTRDANITQAGLVPVVW